MPEEWPPPNPSCPETAAAVAEGDLPDLTGRQPLSLEACEKNLHQCFVIGSRPKPRDLYGNDVNGTLIQRATNARVGLPRAKWRAVENIAVT